MVQILRHGRYAVLKHEEVAGWGTLFSVQVHNGPTLLCASNQRPALVCRQSVSHSASQSTNETNLLEQSGCW